MDPAQNPIVKDEGLASYSSNRLYPTPYPEVMNEDQ